MFPTLLFFITSTSGGQGDRKYDAMKSYLPVWLLVIALLCGVTRAEAFEVDGIYYDLNNEGAVVIRGDTPYSGDVVIPASINYFGEDFPVVSIGGSAFKWCSGLTTITLPESVTSIGDRAFSYCSSLTSVTIPASVERLGTGVFSSCLNLEEIIVSANNPVYSSLDGVLYNKDKTELLKWPDKKLSVTIPESVTSIGESAFEDCRGLTTITIPNSVESIGNSAFSGCSGLTTVTLSESLTSIGRNTFSGCSGLTTITLPESLTSIGDYAFANCNQLESVTVHAVTPPEIGLNTFDNYGIPLYVPAGCKEAYQAAKYWRSFRNIQEMESSVETVLDSEARIYVENHTLHVENVDGDYRVYTITGRLVYAGHAATVQLADAGVYVVRTNSLSQKVIVK